MCALEIEGRIRFHQSIEVDQVGQRGEDSFEEMSMTLVLANFLGGFLVDEEALDVIHGAFWNNVEENHVTWARLGERLDKIQDCVFTGRGYGNTNLFVPVPSNGLCARISQELNELHVILIAIDSRLENIDHTQITIPPLVLFEQLLNDFMNPLNVFEMDDLESDNESVDTHLVSPFIDSYEESDDEEVLNELNEIGNA
nr:hypothetical protein [Tanacetum cinerariifolium]